MTGLIGFTDVSHKYDSEMLLNMRALLKHYDHYVDEQLYTDKAIYASRTHLGLIYQAEQPYICGNRLVSWFEGEFYNQEVLRPQYNISLKTDNELMVGIYDSTRSFRFLRDIDGYFAAVLYNKQRNKIHLITDRYGFKPLYWGRIGDDICWSSELKGFLEHKGFRPIIDDKAIREFFDFGYLLENRTWFKGIELVPPASVLTFDLLNAKIEIQNYWTWSDIKPIDWPIHERELIGELGRLFQESVRSRVGSNERIGIMLSGGLDSRAILAAFPEDYKPLHTFTFGQEGCDDIRIAKQASNTKAAEHHALELNSKNWLQPRVIGVWKSDASTSLLHMHGIEFYDEYKLYMDFSLNGFAGDLVLGGSYLRKSNLDKSIDPSIVKDVTHCKTDISNFNSWYMINKTDPYFINNRVRRFTNSGIILLAKLIEVRMPFWENKLIDFVYGISDISRYRSYIYNKMLLSIFPKYYVDIPWQRTGCRIGYPERLGQLVRFKDRMLNRLKRESRRFGFSFRDLRHYTDYPSWIRRYPANSFFERVLLSKSALYPDYIDKNQFHNYLREHMGVVADHHNELCLALTFELWLQQVFEGRYREGREFL